MRKNDGNMMKTDWERLNTLIHLRFPVERGKVLSGEPMIL